MRVSAANGPRRAAKRADVAWVLRKLGSRIDEMAPGDRLPKHTDLMRELQASERVVLHALSLLNDSGKIVRRNGKGTFVAEPDAAASGIKAGASLTIADARTVVAIAKPDHSFFDRCQQILYNYLEAEDLHLVCRLIKPTAALQFTGPLAPDRPLGFILFRNDLTPLAERLQADGNRVVLVGSQSESMPTDVPTVYGDHAWGGYLAANHLIGLGHRHLGYADDVPLQARRRGHERAVAEAKRSRIEVSTIVIGAEMRETWAQEPGLARDFLNRPNAPTGILVWNDHEAAELLATLTRAGVRVPADISLMGYDNVPESTRVYPALTTIDSGIDQLVRVAVEMLTGAHPPKRSHTVMVVPTLVRRDSAGPPPVSH